MAEGVSQAKLLKFALGVVGKKRRAKTAKSSRLTPYLEAWLRNDAFLQHKYGDFDDNSEHTASTLSALEHYLRAESEEEEDEEEEPESDIESYRAFQSMRKKKQRPTRDAHAITNSKPRSSKRKRNDDAGDLIEQIWHLGRETRKRQAMEHDEPIASDNTADPHADLAVLLRRHLSSLDKALRNNWVCTCRKCSGLSVRLLMPQLMKGSTFETSFDVFFNVRNVLNTQVQEAKITVKSVLPPPPSLLRRVPLTHIRQRRTRPEV